MDRSNSTADRRFAFAACRLGLFCVALHGPPSSGTLADDPPPPAAAPSGSIPVLIVEQRVRSGEDKEQQHRLTLDIAHRRALLEVLGQGEGGRRLALSQSGAGRVLLRLDLEPPRIYELLDAERRFKLHSGDLNRLQDERNLQEANEIQSARELPAAERKKLLEGAYLREDGKRLTALSLGGQKEILGRPCREVTVTENGRAVIHAWMCEALGGGGSFYQLYRRLGAFSKEVLEKIVSLEGLPLAAEIVVVSAGPAFRISSECTRIDTTTAVAADFFELPSGYAEVHDLPSIVACPVCGKEVEPNQAPAKWRDLNTGQMTYLCSKECRRVFAERLKAGVRDTPPPRKDPVEAGGAKKGASDGAKPRD